ncbi:MAG: response regulator transcription factor [Actinomycetota bacterium]|nr:response regulator transcription factor [Actinomycetota bacterium]
MAVRVLVVDDQAPFRDAAKMVVMLTPGFEFIGAVESAEDSIEAVREMRPDLVLMDVNLPGLDGIEATRKIRDQHHGVQVIVCSTYSAAEYEQRALEAGAVTYISKAMLDPDVLTAAWAKVSGS